MVAEPFTKRLISVAWDAGERLSGCPSQAQSHREGLCCKDCYSKMHRRHVRAQGGRAWLSKPF